MMWDSEWNLPTSVRVGGKELAIERQCDYRVILDCLAVYDDADIDIQNKHILALSIFYEKPEEIEDAEKALVEMLRIISGEMEEEYSTKLQKQQPTPRMMSWKHDFKYIAPAVSKILGFDIRTPNVYVHWWTFLGAYQSIGEGVWSTFVSIRRKVMRGEKLEKWEERVYRENKSDIDLPQNYTEDELEFLNS